MTHHPKRSPGDELLVIRREGEDPVPVFSARTTVVLGRSGAGKTRWIRHLVGLDEPASEVQVLGRRMDVTARREVLAYVPDGDGVFLSQTVTENVNSQHHGPDVDPAVAHDALTLVGLDGRAAEAVDHLTFNERRRVSLARAIALQRPVLIVDGALDPTITAFLPVLLVQAPWIRTAIFSSAVADGDVAAAAAVALVDDDRLIAVGTLSELRSHDDPEVVIALGWVTP